MDLKEKIKKLPSCPGVYLMKDSINSIIYVGKSKNLKNRVSSYFQNSKSHSPKVLKLVKNLKDFDYIITDTEFEAFMLECKLIQQIKPMYNRQMKSPKSYCYLKAKFNEKHPYIDLSIEYNKNSEGFYFGPYTHKNTVERAIEGIKECCKIQCNNNSKKASSCLNYSLGLCIGMCLGNDSKEKCFHIFNKILGLLNGSDKSIVEELELNMNTASEKFDFEKAIKYRDYLSAVNYLTSKVKVLEFSVENKNIALLEPLSNDNIKFFLIKGNKILFREHYALKDLERLKRTLKDNIVFYFNQKYEEDPKELGKEELDEAQIIYTYLKSQANNCKHIIISEKWLENINDVDFNNEINKLLNIKAVTKGF